MTVKELIEMLKLFKPDMVITVAYDQYSKTNGRKLTLKPAENMFNVLEIRGFSDPQIYMDNEKAIITIMAFAKTIDPKQADVIPLPKEVVIARDLVGKETFTKIMEEESKKKG